jgi:hypothetical protein
MSGMFGSNPTHTSKLSRNGHVGLISSITQVIFSTLMAWLLAIIGR